MQRHSVLLICLLVGLASGVTCPAQSPSPDERGLWKVWVASTNGVADHAAVVAACREFKAKAPQDPLVVVAAGIEAWRLLKLGDTNAAIMLLEPMLAVPGNATSLQAAGAEMARSWLTRLDREKVRVALKKIYVRDIEFPASLEAIKALKIVKMPPFTDRWGKPWTYRQKSVIKDMVSQQYVLESSRLGTLSDLAKALALPYASRITLEPARLVSDTMVEFNSSAGKPGVLQSGGSLDGVIFAYLGANIIVMADDNHWRVVAKPR